MTVVELEKIITDQYMWSGKRATAPELASYAGISVSPIRKALAKARGCPDGALCNQNATRAWVYWPDPSVLRLLLLEARTRINSLEARL